MPSNTDSSTTKPSKSLLTRLLELFSSIWLGVFTLTALFIYSSVGSAGLWIPGQFGLEAGRAWVHDIYWIIPWTQLHLRQAPGLEMTEFEWFHWWVFDVMIALLCVNLVVATLRRIPFKVINYGVWMIHAGIIILCIGSVIYFSLKLEGDAPVSRRRVVITTPDGATASMRVVPGNQIVVGSDDDAYAVRIASIDPSWELLSGADAGARAYSVNFAISSPERSFIRQVIAGYPQYTEDLVRTDDPQQPMARAKKINADGDPLVDHGLQVELALDAQDTFYLMSSHAIYLREVGSSEWIERPIDHLPRYNDYIASLDEVWTPPAGSDPPPPLRPLDISVPSVDSDDPLAGTDIHIDGFLRFAVKESRRRPGGEYLDPAVSVRLESPSTGQLREYQMVALDPVNSVAENGLMEFRWVADEQAFDDLMTATDPMLRVVVPMDEGEDVVFEHSIRTTVRQNPDQPFTPVPGTPYAFRVESINDGVPLGDGNVVSLVVLEMRGPSGSWRRWAFTDPARNRDMPMDDVPEMHQGDLELDDSILTTYVPSNRPAPVTIVAGPGEEQVRLVLSAPGSAPSATDMAVGTPLEVQPGVTLTLQQFAARTILEERPAIVPEAQRDRDIGAMLSTIKVRVPGDAGDGANWLRYHLYPFASPAETLRRFAYVPQQIVLEDGRVIEMMFSRQSHPLPAPVVLDDFILTTHVGGFSGQTTSIRDWTSVVRFADEEAGAAWGDTMRVSVNAPVEHDGFWFFQSQWDPPDEPRFEGDPGSAGLNYTVLGVGNRHGVYIQLVGCCIAVIGMIYAFYVKPMIKRRRRERVMSQLAHDRAGIEQPAREAVGASTTNGTLVEEGAKA